MVERRDVVRFLSGFAAAMVLVSGYFAARQIYVPVLGFTAGPSFFLLVMIISLLAFAGLFYIGFVARSGG